MPYTEPGRVAIIIRARELLRRNIRRELDVLHDLAARIEDWVVRRLYPSLLVVFSDTFVFSRLISKMQKVPALQWFLVGDPGKTRTSDLRFRKPSLYLGNL